MFNNCKKNLVAFDGLKPNKNLQLSLIIIIY